MSYYNQTIATNNKIELVMVSFDDNVSQALAWAKKEKFPWPHVLSKDIAKASVTQYAARGIPHYNLIDSNGNSLALGVNAAKAKIAVIR